jgi:hypothetical protein
MGGFPSPHTVRIDPPELGYRERRKLLDARWRF